MERNTSLRARIATQSRISPAPGPGGPAESGSRWSGFVPRTDLLVAHKSTAGAIDWRSILEDPDRVRRSGNFFSFVSNITPESARDSAEALEDMRNRNALSDLEWRHFFRGWGGVHGMAALAFLNATPENSAARWKNREAALTGWASRDLAGAQAWLANYGSTDRLTRGEDPFFVEELFILVSQCMQVTDRDAARDYLVAQTVAGHVTTAWTVNWIAGDWNGVDAHSNAETLLARMPADGSHQEIRTAILRHLVHEHGTMESVEFVTRFQAELDSYAVASLASTVAGDDSRKAMAWLDSLEKVAAENKTKALANIVSSWAASDPDVAGSWLLEARRRGEAAPEINASYAHGHRRDGSCRRHRLDSNHSG